MKRKTKKSLVMTIVMMLVLAGCGNGKSTAEKTKQQVLRIGIGSELSTADVSLAMDNTACEVMSQVGEGLFTFDEEGSAVPALATEKVEPSNDGLTYTFKLRPEAKWSNGDPITADVPFNNRLEKSRSGDFDIVLGGWTPVYADPIDFLNLLQSNNSNNFGKWSNPQYDQLLQEANETYANDYEQRWQSLQTADLLVAAEAPLIPLYQITEAYLVNEALQGLTFGPLGSIEFKNVSVKE